MQQRENTYTLLDFTEQRIGAAVRPVAAHDVNLVDSVLLAPGEDVVGIEATASATQEGAALVVDGVHDLRRQHDHVLVHILQGRGEAAVSIHHSVDARDSIQAVECDHDFADDVVQSRADASTRHDDRTHLVLVVPKMLPSTRADIGRELGI